MIGTCKLEALRQNHAIFTFRPVLDVGPDLAQENVTELLLSLARAALVVASPTKLVG